MRRIVLIMILIGWTAMAGATAQTNSDALPKLYDNVPQQLFRTLGPVGVGAKTMLEAREQLQKEAVKVSADAVVAVTCEEGGLKRDGLTFAKYQPYCRGMAVKWVK
jgi:hypothetical protein